MVRDFGGMNRKLFSRKGLKSFRNMRKRLLCVLLAAMLSGAPGKVCAAQETADVEKVSAEVGVQLIREGSYRDYIVQFQDQSRPLTEIVIYGSDCEPTDSAGIFCGEYAGRSDVLRWESDEGTACWEFEVQQAGLYAIELSYLVTSERRDDITPETGIEVNLKLVQQALVPAILSGNGPDVALYVQNGDPVTLACRNGLTALDDFDGIDEVVARFQPDATVPYQYEGKLYGLPLTQNFSMMFCRTDILEELGISPPKTWEDFYKVLTVLQRNNMTAGIPNVTSGNQMAINNNIYAMLLGQRGLGYFTQDMQSTTLDSEEAISAFEQWTGFYKEYGLQTEYYFFQRFRAGDMPIAIENYTMYNQLTIAAPEIRGLWEMYPVPGTVDTQGDINNASVAGGLAAVMLRDSECKQEAFRFLEWFTRADIQTQFGQNYEALMGGGVRYDTANVEAFRSLPWSSQQRELLEQEWQKAICIPVSPASYFLERNLTNAFRGVVIKRKNPRETLNKYNAEINQEIVRKMQEFQ